MEIIEDKIEHNQIVSGEGFEEDSLRTNARSNFVTKVYSILAIQMLVTSLMVALTVFNASFAAFQAQNMWLFWLAIVVSFVSLLVLICTRKASTTSPWNAILLGLFTLSEA